MKALVLMTLVLMPALGFADSVKSCEERHASIVAEMDSLEKVEKEFSQYARAFSSREQEQELRDFKADLDTRVMEIDEASQQYVSDCVR